MHSLDTLKLALVQMDCQLGDVAANVDRILGFVDQAADQGADIVCFPEMCTTGYNLDLLGPRVRGMGLALGGRELAAVKRLAGARGTAVILPAAERTSAGLRNSAFVIDKQGKLAWTYSKTHLFELEREYFEPGHSLDALDWDGSAGGGGTVNIRMGILICYDLGFPEAARKLALQGVQLVFAPSAWRVQDEAIWDLNTRSRAVENNVFVAAVNRVGREGDLRLFGGTRLVDPWGRVIAAVEKEEEEILIAAVDLALVNEARQYFCYLEQRRPDLY